MASVQASHPGLLVAEGGDASLGQAINNQVSSDFGKATETSLPLTLILLAGVFGTLVAASIPVLLALTSALTATWLLAIPGHWLPVGSQTSTVVLLVGMAVGIDYSLFFLRRQREERARGAEPHQAIASAARTSGRAIVVSGLTVMTALAGLFLTGYALFTGMAIGAIVVVGIAVDRFADRAARAAVLARGPGRQGPHPAHRPQARGGGTVPGVGGPGAPGGPPPAAVGRRGHDRDAGDRRARAGHPAGLCSD